MSSDFSDPHGALSKTRFATHSHDVFATRVPPRHTANDTLKLLFLMKLFACA